MTSALGLRHPLAQGPLRATLSGRTRCKRALWSGRASRLFTLRERGSRRRIGARRRELSHAGGECWASRACAPSDPSASGQGARRRVQRTLRRGAEGTRAGGGRCCSCATRGSRNTERLRLRAGGKMVAVDLITTDTHRQPEWVVGARTCVRAVERLDAAAGWGGGGRRYPICSRSESRSPRIRRLVIFPDWPSA